MLEDKALIHLENMLKRIFAFKITHSTFRELQNLILSLSSGNQQFTQDLYESLLVGHAKQGLLKSAHLADHFHKITEQFTHLIRLAKEVFERGDCVNMITSDTIGSNEDTALLNRIRRIDGEEFLFITDIKSALHILQHFQSRLYELEKASQGKVQLQQFKDELLSLSQKFAQMAKS